MMHHRLSAAILLLALGGCGAGSAAQMADAVIDDDRFAQVIVELRHAERDAEVEDLENRRKEILERHGVSAEDLLRFVEVRGGDLDEMIELWKKIDDALNPEEPTPDPLPNDAPRPVAKAGG